MSTTCPGLHSIAERPGFELVTYVQSVAYIGPKWRTEKPRKTNIGTEIAHVTCDPDTAFKVKRSKVKVTRPLYSARP